MRVNVYAEEMTERVEIIAKEIDGQKFIGLRLYLELPATVDGVQHQAPFMHRPGDDDSSAVTFWGKRDLRIVLRLMLARLDAHYSPSPPSPPAAVALEPLPSPPALMFATVYGANRTIVHSGGVVRLSAYNELRSAAEARDTRIAEMEAVIAEERRRVEADIRTAIRENTERVEEQLTSAKAEVEKWKLKASEVALRVVDSEAEVERLTAGTRAARPSIYAWICDGEALVAPDRHFKGPIVRWEEQIGIPAGRTQTAVVKADDCYTAVDTLETECERLTKALDRKAEFVDGLNAQLAAANATIARQAEELRRHREQEPVATVRMFENQTTLDWHGGHNAPAVPAGGLRFFALPVDSIPRAEHEAEIERASQATAEEQYRRDEEAYALERTQTTAEHAAALAAARSEAGEKMRGRVVQILRELNRDAPNGAAAMAFCDALDRLDALAASE